MDNIVKALISNTDDKIGSIVLSLPLAGIIKTYFPHVKIAFLGQSFSRSLTGQSKFIDEFYDWNEMKENNPTDQLKAIYADIIFHIHPRFSIAWHARKAGIQERAGLVNHWYHWLTCTTRINLRKESHLLHLAQLNYKFLKPFGVTEGFLLKKLPDFYGWKNTEAQDGRLSKERFNLILHPFSRDQSRAWPFTSFLELVNDLPEDQYNILITGTEVEKNLLEASCPGIFDYEHVQDTTGQLTLEELIALINNADGLVGCNAGPLHIAAASGIHTLGLYPSINPLSPRKWAPIGYYAEYLARNRDCNVCRKVGPCYCIKKITTKEVGNQIKQWKKSNNTSEILSSINS